MKLGLFGGCFNPPSNIHIMLADNLIKQKIVDKVIFVPVGDYYKKNDLLSGKERYNMLKLSIKEFKNIEIDDIILKSKSMLYASDSFNILTNKYENDDLYFIMGSDNFSKMSNWKNYNEIINKYNYIIIERGTQPQNYKTHNNIIFCHSNQKDVSSTQIRNMLKNNEDVKKLLCIKVLKYIKDNNLYI